MSEKSQSTSDGVDRVMIDIETLGTEAGAAILSIGAVRFGTDGLGREYQASIDLVSCEDAGLSMDADTIQWWMGQDAEVQSVLTGGEPLDDVLVEFADWYGEADEVWANSPSFDCALLEAAYDAVDRDAPWGFWSERDVRTVDKLPVDVAVEEKGNDHDALDDARNQARMVGKTLAKLEGDS